MPPSRVIPGGGGKLRPVRKQQGLATKPTYSTPRTAGSKEAFARTQARVAAAHKPAPSLFGRAKSAVGKVVDKVGDVVIDPRALSGVGQHGQLRGGGVKAKDVANQAGELSGFNSVRRIRNGKGTTMDYVNVGLLALGPAGRAARAASAAKKFGIVSPEMAKAIAAAGYNGVKVNKIVGDMRMPNVRMNPTTLRPTLGAHSLPRNGEAGLRRGGIYRVPAERTGDNEYMGNRLHWLVDPVSDNIFIGEPGQIHGDIYEMLAERGILRDPGTLGQGFLSAGRSHSEARALGTGTRPYSVLVGGSRRTPVSNRWIQLLTRNLGITDKDIDFGMGGGLPKPENESHLMRRLGFSDWSEW